MRTNDRKTIIDLCCWVFNRYLQSFSGSQHTTYRQYKSLAALTTARLKSVKKKNSITEKTNFFSINKSKALCYSLWHRFLLFRSLCTQHIHNALSTICVDACVGILSSYYFVIYTYNTILLSCESRLLPHQVTTSMYVMRTCLCRHIFHQQNGKRYKHQYVYGKINNK